MREFIRLARQNYAEMIVGSVGERMVPTGFRTVAEDDRDGDSIAAKVARANRFDVLAGDLFGDMLGLGDGYTMVSDKVDPLTEVPLITAESPLQVITAEDPATGQTRAALKMFRDDWDGSVQARLYLPGLDGARSYVRAASRPAGRATSLRTIVGRAWDWDDDRSGELAEKLRGRVPVVRFRNRGGVGEFEQHIDALDRINDTLFQRVTIAKYQAFRQRGIEGLPETDTLGNSIDYSDAFLADPGGLWQLPIGAKVWESQVTDLTPIISAIKADAQALAAVTRTPLYFITPDAVQGSAEGAAAQKEGHVFRVEDRRRRGGHGLADTMSLAFAVMGDVERSRAAGIRTIWLPAERYSLQERMTAAVAAKNAGLPQASIYTDVMQYPIEDVVRLEAERASDLLFAPLTVPPGNASG